MRLAGILYFYGMALYVKLKKDASVYIFHVTFSDVNIQMLQSSGRNDQVEFIQADGDELAFILSRFTNLPHAFSITYWNGEMANFIAANFPFP